MHFLLCSEWKFRTLTFKTANQDKQNECILTAQLDKYTLPQNCTHRRRYHSKHLLILHLADAFIQSDLQLHSGYTFFY